MIHFPFHRPRKSISRCRRRGVIGGVTELLIALAVGGIILAGLAGMALKQANSVRNQATALQFQKVHDAATTYIRNEYANILGNASQPNLYSSVFRYAAKPCLGQTSGSFGAYLNIFDTLKTSGYLPGTFKDSNPYNQTYRVLVTKWCIQDSPPQYELRAWVVTSPRTGGDPSLPVPKRDIAKLAALSGPLGGYAAYPDDPAAGGQAGRILGAFGSWGTTVTSLRFNAFDGTMPAGYLASPVLTRTTTSINDYLHRHEVSGQPDATKMATDLGMNGGGTSHDITGAKNILGKNMLATDAVYSGWTMDATGTLQPQGPGLVQAKGDIATTGGNITAQTGNITASGGNITAIRTSGRGGNMAAFGDVIAQADSFGVGGTLAGKYVWLTPSNPVNENDACPGHEGALTYNAGLEGGSLLICRGTPLAWHIYKTDLKIDKVCNQNVVPKSQAACKAGEIPVVALLGVNERPPVNVCAMTSRHWQCYGAAHGNSATDLTNEGITYNTATGAINNWPTCTGTCPYNCTPFWNEGPCLPNGLVGKRGWVTEKTAQDWEFFIAQYDVAFGGYLWINDPNTIGSAPHGGDPDVPGSVWLQYNPWCQNKFIPTEQAQDECLAQTPVQIITGDCSGALFFCLPGGTGTSTPINAPVVISLTPTSATFTVTGTKEGTMAYASKTFTVQNQGTQSAPPLSISLTNSANFNLYSNNCSGRVLSPGGTCTLVVRAQADQNGTLAPAILTATSGSSIQSASLTGTARGFTNPTLGVAPCRELLEADPTLPSGIYTVNIGGGIPNFDVYCDMTGTEVGKPGVGGWTLLARDPGDSFDMPYTDNTNTWAGNLARREGILTLTKTAMELFKSNRQVRIQADGQWLETTMSYNPTYVRFEAYDPSQAPTCDDISGVLWYQNYGGMGDKAFVQFIKGNVYAGCGCNSLINTSIPNWSTGTAGDGDCNHENGSNACLKTSSTGPISGALWIR